MKIFNSNSDGQKLGELNVAPSKINYSVYRNFTIFAAFNRLNFGGFRYE